MRMIAALFGLMLGLVVAGGASALQSDYSNSDLASDALRLAAQVAQDGDDLKDQTPDSLRQAAAAALAKGDTKSMLHAVAGLIAIAPDDFGAWLAYSRAEVASGKTDDILQAASTAAYLAYTKAAGQEYGGAGSGAARRGLRATRIMAPLAQCLPCEPGACRKCRYPRDVSERA